MQAGGCTLPAKIICLKFIFGSIRLSLINFSYMLYQMYPQSEKKVVLSENFDRKLFKNATA